MCFIPYTYLKRKTSLLKGISYCSIKSIVTWEIIFIKEFIKIYDR